MSGKRTGGTGKKNFGKMAGLGANLDTKTKMPHELHY
jgi:hypothetical protein